MYWLAVVLLLVVIPYAWYWWGTDYNRNTTSTVGGPLTVGLSILLGVVSDVVLLFIAILSYAGLALRHDRRRAKSGLGL